MSTRKTTPTKSTEGAQRPLAEVDIRTKYADNPGVAEVHKRNRNALVATVLGLTRVRRAELEATRTKGTSAGVSQQLAADPFLGLERAGRTVPPPYDLLTLAVQQENSTELGPCIDAMAVNVEGFGWRLEPRVALSEDTRREVLKALARERDVAENFFNNATPEGAFEDLRDRLRRDLEATGNAYVEFLETPGSGELDGLNHLPSWTMRLGKLDAEPTEYLEPRVVKTTQLREVDAEPDSEVLAQVRKRRVVEDVHYELREQRRFKRFRPYVQIVGTSTRWFKELGDPRVVDCRDGSVVRRDRLLEKSEAAEPRFTLDGDRVVIREGLVGFPVRLAANAVRHLRLYCTRSPYGLPRYNGHLFAIFGSRAADEINYTTFKNNNIPSMAITVTNGQLTDESAERIQEFVESTIAGDDNYSKFLLLEAEPIQEAVRDPGSMRIEIKALTREQHTDALFVEYQKNNDERVRRAWRFPPVFVGWSSDWSGKTIEASRKLADEQVFGPERQRVDRFWTCDVLLRLGIVWSTFRSLSPNVTENAELVRLLNMAEKTGGLTPRIARQLMALVVNRDLGEVDADLLPPDQPFSLTLAQIMKQGSSTEAPGGGEPTSQGRAGLQVGGGTPRDRASEPAGGDAVQELARMLREEVARRFGGFVPEAMGDFLLDQDEGEDAA